MSGELLIRYERRKGVDTVYLSGEIDIYTSNELKEKLNEIADLSGSDLRMDCSDLNYIDSTGLGIFVGILKKVKQSNGNVYIANLKDNIKKLFLITGLDKVFVLEEPKNE